MVATGLKLGSLISILIVVLAYLYKRHTEEIMKERLHRVLTGLLGAERKVPHAKTRIAIGFGGCLDIFADAITTLEFMNLTDTDVPEHFNSVEDRDQLAKLFAFFFRNGAAAERYIHNESLFEELVAAVRQGSKQKWVLGGNAPAMANRLSLEGNEVLLGASFSPDMRTTLLDNIRTVGRELKTPDIHVLLEYGTGAKWGRYTAPRANRLILHSDNVNPYIDTLEAFEEELKAFKPALLVVGGLQMLDSFPFEEGVRMKRLKKLQNLLATTPGTTKIHFEMASFADPLLMQEILETVVHFSDSLGMNEQELPNLVSMLRHGNVTLVADSYPRIASVLDQMRQVYHILRQTEPKDGRRPLTRLHVHTLAYQAILTTKGSGWKNSMSAAAKAALTAHRHVCGSHNIDIAKARIIMDESFATSKEEFAQRIPFHDGRPVSCWEEDDYEICLAPVLVCTQVQQTGGGGDNVSSAGLVLQA